MGWKTKILVYIVLPVLMSQYFDFKEAERHLRAATKEILRVLVNENELPHEDEKEEVLELEKSVDSKVCKIIIAFNKPNFYRKFHPSD